MTRASSLLRRLGVCTGLVLLATLVATGCTEESNPLAPYQGHRPLELLKVTQSFTPEVQWVGGRVAAVGINRGDRAALDESLVWIRTAPDNTISSVVTIGEEMDQDLVRSFGGTPVDAMEDGETYTFWLAGAAAFGAGLDPAHLDAYTFADTTLAMDLVLLGRGGGDRDLGVQFTIRRDERVTEERYIVSWTPEDVRFRRLAIRQATVGGFQNLVWHILVPEGEPASIASPLTIGTVPEGVTEVTAFPDAGFGPNAYTLWAVTDDWQESFLPSAQGYAFFQMFPGNFQD